MTDEENRLKNAEYLTRWIQRYPESKLPDEIQDIEGPAPNLGPYNGENRLESLNRCWNILKNLGFIQKSKGFWEKRMSTISSIKRSVLVHQDHDSEGDKDSVGSDYYSSRESQYSLTTDNGRKARRASKTS